LIEEAMRRLQSGLPPTDNSETEWERIERNRVRTEGEKQERT